MLVLARKVGEEILIDDAVRLVVVSIRGTQVRLGIEAPRDMVVRRGELSPNAGVPRTLPIDLEVSLHGTDPHELPWVDSSR